MKDRTFRGLYLLMGREKNKKKKEYQVKIRVRALLLTSPRDEVWRMCPRVGRTIIPCENPGD